MCVTHTDRQQCTLVRTAFTAASTTTTVTAKLLVAFVDSHTEYCSEMYVRGAGMLLLYPLEITGRLNCHFYQHRQP